MRPVARGYVQPETSKNCVGIGRGVRKSLSRASYPANGLFGSSRFAQAVPDIQISSLYPLTRRIFFSIFTITRCGFVCAPHAKICRGQRVESFASVFRPAELDHQ